MVGAPSTDLRCTCMTVGNSAQVAKADPDCPRHRTSNLVSRLKGARPRAHEMIVREYPDGRSEIFDPLMLEAAEEIERLNHSLKQATESIEKMHPLYCEALARRLPSETESPRTCPDESFYNRLFAALEGHMGEEELHGVVVECVGEIERLEKIAYPITAAEKASGECCDKYDGKACPTHSPTAWLDT